MTGSKKNPQRFFPGRGEATAGFCFVSLDSTYAFAVK